MRLANAARALRSRPRREGWKRFAVFEYDIRMQPACPPRRQVLLLLAGCGLASAASDLAVASDGRAEADVLAALRAGRVAIFLRHTRTTAGAGDPPGFELDDCSTQRNLDAEGRQHAQRIGQWFAKHDLVPETVRNSPWCRTRDTARLAFGRTSDWPALANVYGREVDRRQVEAVQRYVADLAAGERAVLVSHGSSIHAIVGAYLAQGEAAVVRARRSDREPRLVVVGRISVP
jgi:phosphohistidine phosphatase SixA